MAKITVKNSIDIAAPIRVVFRYIAMWQNARHYVPNVIRMERLGSVDYGKGTRLRAIIGFGGRLLRVAPIETVSEVVEFVDNERIVCRSVSGIDSANTWLFEDKDGDTLLTAVVSYRFEAPFLNRITDRWLAKWATDNVARSLANLKRLLEHGNMGAAV